MGALFVILARLAAAKCAVLLGRHALDSMHACDVTIAQRRAPPNAADAAAAGCPGVGQGDGWQQRQRPRRNDQPGHRDRGAEQRGAAPAFLQVFTLCRRATLWFAVGSQLGRQKVLLNGDIVVCRGACCSAASLAGRS